MKLYPPVLLVLAVFFLTSCASSGSGSDTAGVCLKSYHSDAATKLANMANLAYEEDRNMLKTRLAEQGFSLDEFDIRNKEYSVGGFIAYNADAAVLSFAGTEDLEDWKNNAKTWSEPINDSVCGKQIRLHRGFQNSSTEVITHNNNALATHLTGLQQQGKKIYITGHSLGGALATITAYYLKTAPTPIELAGVYTFGQPYTGDDDFQGCYDAQLKDTTFRFVSDKDVIPKMRLDSSYRHVGTFLFFDKNGALMNSKPVDYAGDLMSFVESNMLEAHAMPNYLALTQRNKEVNPFSCQ